MSRLDEAAKAGIAEWDRVEPKNPVTASFVASHVDSIRAALATADAVMFSDETVAKVEQALYDHREGMLSCYDHIPSSGHYVWCCVCGEHEITGAWREHMASAIAAVLKATP